MLSAWFLALLVVRDVAEVFANTTTDNTTPGTPPTAFSSLAWTTSSSLTSSLETFSTELFSSTETSTTETTLTQTSTSSSSTSTITSTPVPHKNLPRVTIKQGVVVGTLTKSRWSARRIFQFQGIPYAKPPLGPLRFKPPEPASSWDGELNATLFRRPCPQSIQVPLEIEEAYKDYERGDSIEDCLHINVYTPKLSPRKQLPVLIYVHGGSFRVGSAHAFRPNHLLEKDVVLVVPQYRLGPLGFLSLEVDEAPGNAGLLDILLSLEWVRDNIEHFGGDPALVTLVGQSAGAAAVSLMLFSPLVEPGLFHQVVIQSGSAISTWVMDPEPLRHAKAMAKEVNCLEEDPNQLVHCLRNVSATELLRAHYRFLANDIRSGGRGIGGNHPVIQKAGSRRFLIAEPAESFRLGHFKHVPMMGGVTKHEGTFFLGNIYDIMTMMNLTENRDFIIHNLTKKTLSFSGFEDTTGFMTHLLLEDYFKDEVLGNFTSMTSGLIDICGVVLLKASTYTFVQEMSRVRPSFFYSFNFHGRHTKFGYGENVSYPFKGGVAHSDELIYLFPQRNADYNSVEDSIARILVELWTTFAKDGQPSASGVPTWPALSTEKGPYMQIDLKSKVKPNFLQEYKITLRDGLDPPPPSVPPSAKDSATTSTISIILAIITLVLITSLLKK